MKKYILATSAALAFAVSAHAANILYYTDYVIGTDYMDEALTSLAGTHTTTTASDDTDFATLLGGGGFDLAILFAQNYGAGSYLTAVNALDAFLSAGGKGIFTDYSQNASVASTLGFSWGSGVNQDSITILDSNLSTGIAGPISLSNTGWGIFSMNVAGPKAAEFADGSGAITISGNLIVNGFLNDTFADGSVGTQLYVNEIEYQLSGGSTASVPDATSTLSLLGAALIGLGIARRRSNRS